jgi:hypothetical protein
MKWRPCGTPEHFECDVVGYEMASPSTSLRAGSAGLDAESVGR